MIIGLLLIGAAGLFDEIANAIGKEQALHKKETIFTIGLIKTFWAVIILLIPVLLGVSQFQFSLDSLPTFLPRLILEIILSYVAIKALVLADRSTATIFSVLTVPFLLIIDIFFGYVTSPVTAFLIALSVIVVLVFSLRDKNIGKRGIGFVITASMLAVVTTQLYKYNIENFNSVAAEQSIIIAVMVLFYLTMSLIKERDITKVLWRRKVMLQAISSGITVGLFSYAIYYLPPSIMIAAKRVIRMLWALLSGRFYFKEDHGMHKFAIVGVVTVLVWLSAFFS